MYDYAKLKGRIVEICGTQTEFARKIGLSSKSVSEKLCQKKWWKQNEISKAITVLKLSDRDIQSYFFTAKVQN